MSVNDDLGWTDVMHSVRNHQVCCVEHILKHLQTKENSQLVTKHGIDLICLAVASGCINMVKMVLSYTSYQEGPINPLCVASFYGYCDIIIYLHEYNSNFINMTAPSSGLTCLMFAVINNHLQAVELLLSLGANPYIRNANQETVLDMTTNKQIQDLLISKTKLNVSEPRWHQIRNSPMKIKKTDSKLERKHKCSLTLSPYTPKRLNFLSPNKLKEKTLKTKNLLWEKFKKRKNHGKLECLLKQMDLLDYQKLFVEQEIDNKTLFTLSDNDLKQLGIEDEMERAKIVDKLNTYND
ncbi:hypothetical protein M8J75_007687 [Diaphorina citri]|nr:hypothetical protein M8J75_007687 [Diaphorina citri]